MRDQERRSAHGLARLLQRLDACRGYRELGDTSMAEYAAVEQDMTARRTRELLRIGRALPDLPTLDQVFGQGKLGWTKVREISRVACPETEAAWTERALELNPRQLEGLVSAAVAGEAPPPSDELPKKPSRKRILWNAGAADAQVIQDALALVAQGCAEEGGTHAPENLIALCTAHHRLVHRGNLTIEWAASGLLEVRRASGRRSWRRLWREPGAIEAAEECGHDPRGLAATALPRGGLRELMLHAELPDDPRGSGRAASPDDPEWSGRAAPTHDPRGAERAASPPDPRARFGRSRRVTHGGRPPRSGRMTHGRDSGRAAG